MKKRSLTMWLRVIGIWTLVAMSMSTQLYLNTRFANPGVAWFSLFLKQLPAWYLCVLLTGIVLFFYDRYPLDSGSWKKNIVRQGAVAVLTLSIFSHFRLWAIAFSVDKDVREFSTDVYRNAYLSQVVWDLAIYVLITVAIFADRSNRKRRLNERYASEMELRNRELENQLTSAQLQALKLKLSPHFLFNALNTVSSLVRAGEYARAVDVNAKLGDFLRSVLYADPQQFVTLDEEIRYADLYLGIELVRFSDRLVVEKNINEACLSVSVPHFILQPIIENSIKHGIARNDTARIISIQASVSDGTLKLDIYNEGTLLPDHWNMGSHGGIGLKIVSDRLAKIYGDRSSFSIGNHTGRRGVQASLHIPVAS
jgi:hypothetical protein